METDVCRLIIHDKEIILVGTNHVSSESADLVVELIGREKPDVICIEWDQKRFDKNMNPDDWSETDLMGIIKSKQFPMFMFSIIYKHFQKKFIKDNTSEVGGEFVKASIEAEKIGSELILVDRDSHVTFKRAWSSLKLRDRVTFPMSFASIFEDSEGSPEEIEKLLESENFEPIFVALKDKYPKFWIAFIGERDEYIATKVLESLGNKTLVVLGKAHVEGVLSKIECDKRVNTEDLELLPVPSLSSRVMKWLVPTAVLFLLVYSFFVSPSVGIEQLKTWIVWKGSIASLFTLLALAHPLAIAAAFLLAPFTTFIPFVSVGIFTALIETKFRKPRVKDFENVDSDLKSIKSIYQNRILRIFLVFFLSNTGSILGNFLGGLDIIRNLF